MSEKRFKLSDWCGEQSVSNVIDIEKQTHLTNIKVLDLLNELSEENEQLKVLLKEAEYEIELLKKTKQGLLEAIVENDSNKAMILEFISNVRGSRMCDGCKHKDKPVEWYLENGLSITNGVCDRYEPED